MEPTGVWEVHLERGDMRERGGTLVLERDALVFVPDDGGATSRIALEAIVRARRLIGSPVLMVRHTVGGVPRQTAFYFVEPPPLRAADAEVGAGPFAGSQRRRNRRQGVVHLTAGNRRKREDLRAWERAVREAIAGR